MSNGFICSDNEYERLGEAYKILYSHMEADYDKYLVAIGNLTESAVTSGNVAQNLKTFQSSANAAKGAFDSKAQSTSSAFIASIKIADRLE